MNKLIIEQTSNSPKVILDPENRKFEISGESRPENVNELYMPILEWFDTFDRELSTDKYLDNKDQLEFNFNFEYFNSISAKFILDIFKKIGKLRTKEDGILVKWHYEKDDEDMLEVGKEMSRLVRFPFDYIRL
ncbi:MAG: DUF1987 domain-containing protein [Bacteroidales bacterium]|nr:DUF1987 domain-containing protein [Bacteroidales bacterium]